MKIEKEPFYPGRESMVLINNSTKDLKTDLPELIEWHKTYKSNHIERIAF